MRHDRHVRGHRLGTIVWLSIASGLGCTGQVGGASTPESDGETGLFIYVSNTGSDTGDGSSIHAPVSLARAQELARSLTPTVTTDIRLRLLGGTYALEAPVTLTDADSGLNGHRVIWQAHDRADPPVLSGGTQIAGWSQVGTSGIWQASVPTTDFRQIWVGDREGQMASSRLPVRASSTTADATANERYVVADPATLPLLADASRAEFRLSVDWREFRFRIKSISDYSDPRYELPQRRAVLDGTQFGDSGDQVFEAPALDNNPTLTLVNAPELLDEPGEFYADPQTHLLSYWPRPGEDLATTPVFIPRLRNVLLVDGTSPTQRVTAVDVRGLTFAYTNWTAPSDEGFVPVQSYFLQRPLEGGRYSEYAPAAVEVSRADDISFVGNRFIDAGSAALFLREWVDRSRLEGNTFTELAGAGLQIGYHDQDDKNGVITNLTVDSNVFYRIGLDYHSAVPIGSFSLRDSTITHNHIEDAPYTAISLGDFNAATGGNQITFNRVRNFLKYNRDGGGIYLNGNQSGTDGSPTIVSDNYFQDFWVDEAAIYVEDFLANVSYARNVVEQDLVNIPELSRHPRKWLWQWSGRNENIYLGEGDNANFVSPRSLTYDVTPGKNTVYVDPTRYDLGARPPGAQAIVSAAGPRAPYASLLEIIPDPAAHRAPVATAGASFTVSQDRTLILPGTVRDDGQLFDRTVLRWSQMDGPGAATFDDAGVAQTRVDFTAPGTYHLKLAARDGVDEGSTTVTVGVTARDPGADVAQNKPVSVSSTYGGFNSASLTDGSFDIYNAWLADDQDKKPSFQVDLGNAVVPSAFVLSARNGSLEAERSNFQVQASNTPDFSTYRVLVQRGGDAYPAFSTWTAHPQTSTAYRYYRVRKEDTYLGACEFQVFSGGAASN